MPFSRPPAFKDYYRVLEVEPSASTQEIRRSFRRLVLLAHPDKNPQRLSWSEHRIRELIQAFEVIGDGERRRRFDVEYRARSGRGVDPAPDESQLFFFRRHDRGACALRILYFLLHRRGEEACSLLSRMEEAHGAEYLAAELDREDYLDSLFLLAEFHLERREYPEALRRLKAFYLRERNARFPRHYLDAVVAHLKDLYFRKLPQSLPPLDALRHLREALDLSLGRRNQAVVVKLRQELRDRIGRARAAAGR